ncbi:hypothetical protein ACMSX7_001206 [Cronobacter malonaticus]
MSEISEAIASEIADFFAGFGGPGEPDIQSGEAQRLLTERLLSVLALRERAEPVYQLWSSGINQWVECDKGRYEAHAHVPAQRRVLYTAPPAAVVPFIHSPGCDLFKSKIVDGVFVPRFCDCASAPPAPVVPEDVLDALRKVAKIRLDFNDFDGDRRGMADCLGEAEEALIEVVNRRAAMLGAALGKEG